MTSFTKGPWKRDKRGECLVGSNGNEVVIYNCGLVGGNKTTEGVANAHLIAAAPDMYKSLERQRTGLINLIDLNLITESQIESVRHEISLIDNELSRARGD